MNIYLVRATDERNDVGTPLWWSNEGGWSEISEAIVFTADERQMLKAPLGGEWVKFSESGERA